MKWSISFYSSLLFCLSLCLGYAADSGAVDCRVAAADGAPLSGARVSVIGRSGSIVAGKDGCFVLDPVPEVPFTLLIARPDGVAVSPVAVTALPQDGRLEITVEPAGSSITVVSDAVPDLEVPPAVASTILGRADMAQRQPQRLTDVLENLPGTGRTGAGHAVVPGLRGLPKHRTLILLDDGRVTAERRAGPSATFLNPDSVEELEVIRGPGCVAYGSDAFGGVIRARSRMPSPVVETTVRYDLMLGSSADEKGAGAEVTTGLLGGGLLVAANYRDFGDYRSPGGEIFNSAAEERSFRVAYQAAVGNGVLHLGWRSDLARDVGKPAPDSYQKRTYYPDEDSHRFNIGFERPGPGRWRRLALSLALDDYRLVLDKDRVATATDPRRIDQSEVEANDYELRLEAERSLGKYRLVVGANAYGRFNLQAVNRTHRFDLADVVETDSEVSVADARRDDLGLFIAADRDLGRWGLSMGLRADRVTSTNNGGYFGDLDTSHSDLSGFLALSYDLSDRVELIGQVARGFRDALLSDRYYRGQTGRGFITGNPELQPETSLQYDLAVRIEASRRFRLAAYGYWYRIDDLIERYKVAGVDYLFRNRGEAELSGLELEASLRLAESLLLQLGTHYLRGEVIDDGSPTDDVPAPGLFAVLRGEPGPSWWWMARAAVSRRDDRPGPSEVEVPGYWVLDAGVGWRFSDALQLQLLGRNLLDRSYPASADADAVLASGRAVQLVLSGKL